MRNRYVEPQERTERGRVRRGNKYVTPQGVERVQTTEPSQTQPAGAYVPNRELSDDEYRQIIRDNPIDWPLTLYGKGLADNYGASSAQVGADVKNSFTKDGLATILTMLIELAFPDMVRESGSAPLHTMGVQLQDDYAGLVPGVSEDAKVRTARKLHTDPVGASSDIASVVPITGPVARTATVGKIASKVPGSSRIARIATSTPAKVVARIGEGVVDPAGAVGATVGDAVAGGVMGVEKIKARKDKKTEVDRQREEQALIAEIDESGKEPLPSNEYIDSESINTATNDIMESLEHNIYTETLSDTEIQKLQALSDRISQNPNLAYEYLLSKNITNRELSLALVNDEIDEMLFSKIHDEKYKGQPNRVLTDSEIDEINNEVTAQKRLNLATRKAEFIRSLFNLAGDQWTPEGLANAIESVGQDRIQMAFVDYEGKIDTEMIDRLNQFAEESKKYKSREDFIKKLVGVTRIAAGGGGVGGMAMGMLSPIEGWGAIVSSILGGNVTRALTNRLKYKYIYTPPVMFSDVPRKVGRKTGQATRKMGETARKTREPITIWNPGFRD